MYNTILELEKWTGKCIKDLNNIQVKTDHDYFKVLIVDWAKNQYKKEIYLNADLQKFMFYTKFFDEVNDVIVSSFNCPKCSAENIVEFTKENIHFNTLTLNPIKLDGDTIEFKTELSEIDNNNIIEFTKNTSDFEKLEWELCFYIKSISDKIINSSEVFELKSKINNLDIKSYRSIINDFTSMNYKFELKLLYDNCFSCGNEKITVNVDRIPNYVKDMLS